MSGKTNSKRKRFSILIKVALGISSCIIAYSVFLAQSAIGEGQISGTVTNNSGQSGDIYVFCVGVNSGDTYVTTVSTGSVYSIHNVANGKYMLIAVVDSLSPPLPETHNRPQSGEAWGLYNGIVEISTGSIAENIDIEIGPLPTGGIKGVVSYTGAQQGRGNLVVEATALSLFTNFPSYGWGHVVIPAGAQFPVEYTINYLANDPNYSVRAYIDLNGNLELRL